MAQECRNLSLVEIKAEVADGFNPFPPEGESGGVGLAEVGDGYSEREV